MSSATKTTPKPADKEAREPIPLSERPLDWLYILFWIINLTIITYIVDVEQLTHPGVPDLKNPTYPVWPPKMWCDIIWNYAATVDPLILARPVWWKATIWWDSLFFGPYYAVALYAFWKGRDWIRDLSIVWSCVLVTIVTIILSEELWGSVPALNLPLVLGTNAPWLLLPLINLARMLRTHHPFTRKVGSAKQD